MQNSLVLFFSTCAALLLSTAGPVRAGSATWSSNPGDGVWTDSMNWTPNTIPNGSADIATFGISNITNVAIPATGTIEVDSIVFNAGASAYTISLLPSGGNGIQAQLTISGAGFINNSGIVQNIASSQGGQFNPSCKIIFTNNATAGSMMVFTNFATGSIGFGDNASAGHATFMNLGGASNLDGPAHISFGGSSTADHGTFINTAPGGGGTLGAVLSFGGSATAGDANITNNGTGTAASDIGARTVFNSGDAGNAIITNQGSMLAGGDGGGTIFQGSSSASNATLIANGGTNGGGGGKIIFNEQSTGGTSRVEVFGNGLLDISGHNATGVTIGSLEGSGNVFLGARNLSVGSNNMSTSFSGIIQDGTGVPGSVNGVGGSLTKIGSGTLSLSGANTYTGATTVNAGKLIVDGSITSNVTVDGGTLGGSGTVAGVTVNNGGTLSPGNSPGILHVAGNVSLMLGATYLVDINGTAVGTNYDQLDVMGEVALGNATLEINLGFAPNVGDVFTIIANDATDAVSGMFAGLSEGEQFAADGGAFVISYHGGDGNDVTLTAAVPEPATWALLLVGAGFVVQAAKHRSCA